VSQLSPRRGPAPQLAWARTDSAPAGRAPLTARSRWGAGPLWKTRSCRVLILTPVDQAATSAGIISNVPIRQRFRRCGVGLLALLVLAFGSRCAAAWAGASLSGPKSVSPGQRVSFRAAGLPPGDKVDVELQESDQAGENVGTPPEGFRSVTVDSAGTAACFRLATTLLRLPWDSWISDTPRVRQTVGTGASCECLRVLRRSGRDQYRLHAEECPCDSQAELLRTFSVRLRGAR
jgi:hypothetical protein